VGSVGSPGVSVQVAEELFKQVAHTHRDNIDRRAACNWAGIVPNSNLGAHSAGSDTVRAQEPEWQTAAVPVGNFSRIA